MTSYECFVDGAPVVVYPVGKDTGLVKARGVYIGRVKLHEDNGHLTGCPVFSDLCEAVRMWRIARSN